MEYKLQTNNVTAEAESVNNRPTIIEAVRKNACILEECLGLLNSIREHLIGESLPPRQKNEPKALIEDVCENVELAISLARGLDELYAILGA